MSDHEHESMRVDRSHGGSMGWEYIVCRCGGYALLDDDGLPGDWQEPDGLFEAVPDGV